ncbi:3-hydroxybenzoate 6-hydroxylase [Rhizoctonia solani AG-1 IB]|uniref:3-hydroxybenzoate 6-hydroxylase n=2 Tax=Thanatephorus cucumeris (strain AG1-IB / isolate 7/3/14) TaxID=1108050 RepID=M5BY55_THACB|nr:3-hydroxybenzoate 6-hydroxylase [Rhizoctonia solani AG-1 IB]
MSAPIKAPLAAADASVDASKAQSSVLFEGRTTSNPLNIVIVGCGLGGLAAAYCLAKAGHKVTMFEGAPAIGEVGAGIQVTPNVSRLLIRWGLGEQLENIAVRPEGIVFRRWNTGEKVGETKWGGEFEDEHGAPYYHIHRADFHKLLYDITVPLIDLHLNSYVTSIDPEAPSVTIKNEKVFKCDLIIGADGVKSAIREQVVGHVDRPVDTGDAAYRAIVSTDHLLADPELRSLVEHPEMTGWMGPGRHIMGYCIRAKKEYNMVLLHPDDGATESWSAEGSGDNMRKDFEGWEPRVDKLLKLVPSTLKWALRDRLPLDTWIHKSNKVVLLGDACHPMLPYRAQGAAMAIEDGSVLGNLFSHLTDASQIPYFLRAYETLRLSRTANTQAQSRLNQKIFHYEDGPEQEARDASMRAAMRGQTEGSANQWADKAKSKTQFSYDADAAAEEWWREVGSKERALAGAK